MKDSANQAGGFVGKFEAGSRPALLVIDFQRGMTDPSVSTMGSDCTEAIMATNTMIAAARKRGPVIFTACSYHSHAMDAGAFLKKCPELSSFVHGSAACELDPRLDYDSERDILLYKTQASAFFGTPLAGILASISCNMLLVAGCSTSGCVRASVVDAVQHGFPPFVVEECVTDRSAAQHRSNLIDMSDKYANLVSLSEMDAILKEIQNDVS